MIWWKCTSASLRERTVHSSDSKQRGNRAVLYFWWGSASEIRHRGWAVDPSIDRTFSALHCSVAEDVMKSGTVDDSADVLARCAQL